MSHRTILLDKAPSLPKSHLSVCCLSLHQQLWYYPSLILLLLFIRRQLNPAHAKHSAELVSTIILRCPKLQARVVVLSWTRCLMRSMISKAFVVMETWSASCVALRRVVLVVETANTLVIIISYYYAVDPGGSDVWKFNKVATGLRFRELLFVPQVQ